MPELSSGPLQPLPSYLTMFFDVPTGYTSHHMDTDADGDPYRGN